MKQSGRYLVSVALATYNGERYLKEQLDSIYNQTYKNIEVIVSDDKSTDSTTNILEHYKQKFRLVYSVNEKNIGLLKNFENAVSKCTGNHILLSDQDDIWMPNKIDTLVKNIGDFSLIYSDGYIINDKKKLNLNKISQQKWIKPFGIDSTDQDLFKYLIFNSFILGCSIMFKRELLKTALPFYESYRNHDWWISLCADNQQGVQYINKALFYYRIHETNSSIKPKLSFSNKLFRLFSIGRIESRKILLNNDKLIFNYLDNNNFYRNSHKDEYINKVRNRYNVNKSLFSRLRLMVFLIKTIKFIFPKNNIFKIPLLILQKTIEFPIQKIKNKELLNLKS